MVVFRLFSVAWYVQKFYGYRLTSRGDELHVQCGLFTRVSATVPRKRIQIISVHRGWLARLFGLASIRLETSGGGTGNAAEDASQTIGRRWFVPILREADLNRVLRSLDPDLTWDYSTVEWVPLAGKAGWRMVRALWITTFLLLGLVAIVAWLVDWRFLAWGAASELHSCSWALCLRIKKRKVASSRDGASSFSCEAGCCSKKRRSDSKRRFSLYPARIAF